jgi:SAM-dependent methyltransferase
VWRRRGLDATDLPDDADRLTLAMRLNGYDGPTSGGVGPDDFAELARSWADRAGCGRDDSVYEVGCGAGSFLAAIERATGCTRLAGCDLSPGLVEAGRSILPHLALDVADAAVFPLEPQVDHAVSFGMFFYLASTDDAAQVLQRMVRKATRSVSVLDVPDVRLAAQAEAHRRALWGVAEYEQRYAGLDHLYFEQSWFREQLPEPHWHVDISPQSLANYDNAPFRFNVVAVSRR